MNVPKIHLQRCKELGGGRGGVGGWEEGERLAASEEDLFLVTYLQRLSGIWERTHFCQRWSAMR